MDAWRNDGGVADDGDWSSLGRVATGLGGKSRGTVVFADLDGDGRDDYLVVDDRSGAVHAWRNDGGTRDQWSWTPYGLVATGESPARHIQFADIDDDGRDDYLVVDRATGALRAWRNEGGTPGQWDWTPQGQIAASVGARGSSIRIAELNGDGRADYLQMRCGGAVRAWLNNGGDAPR